METPPSIVASLSKSNYSTVEQYLHKRSDAYAILDGARDDTHPFLLQCFREGMEAFPLAPHHQDSSAEERLIMPYLIKLDADGRVMGFCRSKLGENIFVLVLGDEDMYTTCNLLSRMLWVHIPGHKHMAWFRFYSPSILSAFLRMATPEHLHFLFAESLKAYWVEIIPGANPESGQSEYERPVQEMECFVSPSPTFALSPFEHMHLEPEHLDLFEESRFHHFTVNLCRRIAARKTVADRDWRDMRGQVEAAIYTAEEYGIFSYPCLCLYIDLACQLGWEFASQEPALNLLTKVGIPDNLKYDAMLSFLETQRAQRGNGP